VRRPNQKDVKIAFKMLDVLPEELLQLPQITPQLKQISKRAKIRPQLTKSWPIYLSFSEDPQITYMIKLYYGLKEYYANLLPIEAYCQRAGINPKKVLKILNYTVSEARMQESSVVTAMRHPDVVTATINNALTPEGVQDRVIIHKATGYLPTPKGSQTVVQVTTNAQTHVSGDKIAVLAPSPETTIRRLADRFNESHLLPQGTQEDSEEIHRGVDTVEEGNAEIEEEKE
jgi:hypothetical protein